MPRAVLMFKLPQERHEHMCATKGLDLALSLWSIKEHVWKKLHDAPSDQEAKRYEELMDEINEVLDRYCIDLEEMVQ